MVDAKLNQNVQLLEENVGINKTQLLNNSSTIMVVAMKYRLSGRCMDDTGKSAEYCMKQAEMQLRDEARAGLPIAFLGRMIGGRIARIGLKSAATSVAKKAAMAAGTHVLNKQVEKAMEKAEGGAGFFKDTQDHFRREQQRNDRNNYGHAHAGVIPLELRIG